MSGAFAPASHHRVLARDDSCEINMDLASAHAQSRASARNVRGARTGDHCLRRCAAVVRACSAEECALDERDLAAAVRQSHGKGYARLAASDDQHVDSHRARRSRRVAAVEVPIASRSPLIAPCMSMARNVARDGPEPTAAPRIVVRHGDCVGGSVAGMGRGWRIACADSPASD